MRDFIIIGVDGGATKIHAREVVFDEQKASFYLGEHFSNKSYREQDGYDPEFVPVDLAFQLEQLRSVSQPTTAEQIQGKAYMQACAEAVAEVAAKAGKDKILLGIGMPGLKTKNGKGIAVMFNGPRMPSYAEEVSALLELKGLQLIAPIAHLGSDADYCGMGEDLAQGGSFLGLSNAYYLGGGTGSADAIKLDGKLISFDKIKEWIAKTWELKNKSGISLEQVTSVGGIQKLYAKESGLSLDELNASGIYPLQIVELVKNGNKDATKTYQIVIESLSDLLCERIETLYCGWKGQFEFVNPSRSSLSETHGYLGSYFEKIVIGQRLGELFDDPIGNEFVRKPVLENLQRKLQDSPSLDSDAKLHYANLEDILITSNLREAPVLGAGIDAWLTFVKEKEYTLK